MYDQYQLHSATSSDKSQTEFARKKKNMPNKGKLTSRSSTVTPASIDSRESRKESLDLIDESIESFDNCDENGERNVRFKVRGVFLRVNIFAF